MGMHTDASLFHEDTAAHSSFQIFIRHCALWQLASTPISIHCCAHVPVRWVEELITQLGFDV